MTGLKGCTNLATCIQVEVQRLTIDCPTRVQQSMLPENTVCSKVQQHVRLQSKAPATWVKVSDKHVLHTARTW